MLAPWRLGRPGPRGNYFFFYSEVHNFIAEVHKHIHVFEKKTAHFMLYIKLILPWL